MQNPAVQLEEGEVNPSMREAALLLQNPKLALFIIDEVQAHGLQNEEDTLLILTIKIMLRLVIDCIPTSSNLVLSDYSGAGKDAILKKILLVLLVNKVSSFHRTNLTPAAFNYWQPKNANKEPVSWDGKVLVLEDLAAETIKSQAFKTMASGGNEITTVKDQAALEIEIMGKPVLLFSSVQSSLADEQLRRYQMLRIDTSSTQTGEIVGSALKQAATGKTPRKVNNLFCHALQTMERYDVIIPYAEELKPYFSIEDLSNRSGVWLCIDFIKSSTVMHQRQRKTDDKGRLIATIDDYELGRFAYNRLKGFGSNLNIKEETLVRFLIGEGKPATRKNIVSADIGITNSWISLNKDRMIDNKVIRIKHLPVVFSFGIKDVEHLEAVNLKQRTIPLPPAKDLFPNDSSGYIASGEFFAELNKRREKKGLERIREE